MPGFDVDRHLDVLRRSAERIRRSRPLVAHCARTLLEARRPRASRHRGSRCLVPKWTPTHESVHHGGAGTTTTATRAGAPQLVVPQGGDQTYWAGRVAELGIGVAHDGPTPTVQTLSNALRTALTPATRVRALALAGSVRTDGAETAAKLLATGAAHRPVTGQPPHPSESTSAESTAARSRTGVSRGKP